MTPGLIELTDFTWPSNPTDTYTIGVDITSSLSAHNWWCHYEHIDEEFHCLNSIKPSFDFPWFRSNLRLLSSSVPLVLIRTLGPLCRPIQLLRSEDGFSLSLEQSYLTMDDGELDCSNQGIFSNTNMNDQLPNSCSMDSFFDEILNDIYACTHTHTCDPPGPDLSHTHTCLHVHTKILSAQSEDNVGTHDASESIGKKSNKRPVGNREAVRKYREKNKARAASLEDEVVELRTINQQLRKELQGKAVLEAEIARLKCLLVDIRGRIESEIGSFPYQKSANPNLSVAYVMNPCDLRCDDQLYCLHPGVEGKGGEASASNGQGLGACDIGNVQCMGNSDFGFKDK